MLTENKQKINLKAGFKGDVLNRTDDSVPSKYITESTESNTQNGQNKPKKNLNQFKKNVEITVRFGFTYEYLVQVSSYSFNLKELGFPVPEGTSGWFWQSDTSSARQARLDIALPSTNGGKPIRYLQTSAKGVVYKHFVANADEKTVYISEGFYKGLAAHKVGKNVITTAGVNSILSKGKLNQELEELLTGYEKVVLTYDIDGTDEKRLYCEVQMLNIATALIKAFKQVEIISAWNQNTHGKDLDAILVNKGADELQRILNQTKSARDWGGFAVKASYQSTFTENSNYISEALLEQIAKHRINFVQAPMGSGKTHMLGNLLNKFPDIGTVIICPLIVLGRQICNDLKQKGVDILYREDLDVKSNWHRIVTCLESLKPNSKLKINLDGSQFRDKILVIDELSQVVSTLISGNTISKERATIVQCLSNAMRSAYKCVFLGADISDFDVSVTCELLGIPEDSKEICKYQNTAKRNTGKACITSVTEALSTAHIAINAGFRVMLGVDSQKTTSKYSGENIKELVTKYSKKFDLKDIPDDKVLVLDSVTTKTIGHAAYEIVQKGRFDLLLSYQLVICSPSVDKGVSFDAAKKYFDLNIIIHMGASDPDSVCQFTMRDRNLEASRIIAFGGQVSLKHGGAETSKEVRADIKRLAENMRQVSNVKDSKKIYETTGLEPYLSLGIESNIDLDLEKRYLESVAIGNLKMSIREHYVKSKLQNQGFTFYDKVSDILPAKLNELIENTEPKAKESRKLELEKISVETTKEAALREFNAPILTDKQIEKLKDQPALTQSEIDSRNRYFTQRSASFNDICPEDIEDNKWGKFIPEARWFYLNQGRPYVQFIESNRLASLRAIPIHNPTAMMSYDVTQLTSTYAQDAINGSLTSQIGLLEKIKVKEAIEWAKQFGIADLFLTEFVEQKYVPEPVLECIKLTKLYKKEIESTFGWDYQKFAVSDINFFKHILGLVGFKYSEAKQTRVTCRLTKEVVRPRISTEIIPDRKQGLQNKRFAAKFAELDQKHTAFINNQLLLNCGRYIINFSINNGSIDELITKYNSELLLESSRRLPKFNSSDSSGYGLSEHFKILAHKNGFKPNVDTEIIQVTEANVDSFNEVLQTWIKRKIEIGFDTETYESLVHKTFCKINEKGNYYWLNPYTNRKQIVVPGLDQNNNLVRLIQLTDGERTYVIDLGRCDGAAIPLWMKNVWVSLEKLAAKNELVGHNIKFDISSIIKYDLHVNKPYCSMITTQLVFGDCGAAKVLSGGYGLKSVGFNLLGLKVDKEQQTSNWGAETLSPEQIKYAAKDAVIALLLKQILEMIIENPTKWNLVEMQGNNGRHANEYLIRLENQNNYYTALMQHNGVPANTPEIKKAIDRLYRLQNRVLEEWRALKMPCEPTQAGLIVEEINKRYNRHEHPFTPFELIQALGVEIVDDNGEVVNFDEIDENDLELPSLDKPLSKSNKDILNENSDLPEFKLLAAYRSYATGISHLSKCLISAEIHDGRVKTEYKPMSGTGRMACGNQKGLGTSNLQALMKKAEGRFFGFTNNESKAKQRTKKDWWLPSVEESVNLRVLFSVKNQNLAFITEDANSSHARLAVGFGKCEFGKKALVGGIDAHSMFAMKTIKIILRHDSTAFDHFPVIRDFVNSLSDEDVTKGEVTKTFKDLDEKITGGRFRYAAKKLFYSVLNGAQADKMRKELTNALGKSVGFEAGEEMFKAFWSLYAGIKGFVDKILAYAETHSINLNGYEFNITELVDGSKLMYPRKNGELAVTNLIACQWSRIEAIALKKVLKTVAEDMPQEFSVELVNMVHDEIGFTCKAEHWQDAYRIVSDEFAKQYDIYLDGFIPCDEPTEDKLFMKTHKKISVVELSENGTAILDDKGNPKTTNLTSKTKGYSVNVGDKVLSTTVKGGKVKTEEVEIVCDKFNSYWLNPKEQYIPHSWADK